MSVRHGILAILTLGDCYGYQLRAEFDRRTGTASTLNVGQIYNTLDRLHRDGLVRPAGSDAEGHLFYSITADGRAACAEWFESATPRSSGGRDELAIKVSLATTMPEVDVQTVIRVQRAETSRRIAELDETRRSADVLDQTRLTSLIALESALASAHAELSWLSSVESLVAMAIATGWDIAVPLGTDPVRRGRPTKSR